MAATERWLRRRQRRTPLTTTVAAGLLACSARSAQAQSTVDLRYLYYKESAGRTTVQDPTFLWHQDLGPEYGQIDLLLAYDAISGASPSGGYPTLDTTTSASGNTTSSGHFPQTDYRDTRSSAALAYARRWGSHLPTVDVSYSRENDYRSRSLGLADAWTLAHGRGTFHFGLSLARDLVVPVTNHLRLNKSTTSLAAGFTWIVGPRDLFDVSTSLMNSSGYLDDPYKIVPIGAHGADGTAPERRPDSRSRHTLVVKYAHHFRGESGLKLSYRYYWDDWSIGSHTLDLEYGLRIGRRWTLTPRARLYTQSAASFYGSSFPTLPTYRSADYRLSAFNSWLGGLTVDYRLSDRLSLNLGATYQTQTGKDRIAPIVAAQPASFALLDEDEEGGGGSRSVSASAADLKVTTVTVGFQWRF